MIRPDDPRVQMYHNMDAAQRAGYETLLTMFADWLGDSEAALAALRDDELRLRCAFFVVMYDRARAGQFSRLKHQYENLLAVTPQVFSIPISDDHLHDIARMEGEGGPAN